jgi:nitroreductase
MDAITAISERKGMRKFQEHSLPKVILENILDLATKAPSCKNRQPWKFSIIQGNKISELIDIVQKSDEDLEIDLCCLENAAAVILVFNRLSHSEEDYDDKKLVMDSISIGMAIQNMLLVSQTFNLGSLLISDFIDLDEKISTWLKEDSQLVSAVLVGFPDESPEDKPKTHFSQISSWYE